jgi:hypothetical protein
MREIILLVAAVFLFTVSATAQKPAKQLPQHTPVIKEALQTGAARATSTLQGYLVDAMCARGMAKHPETAMSKAARHTSACAQEEECAKSGFGVFSNGVWYKFDGEGDRQALQLLKKTKTERGVLVDVAGSAQGDRFAVKSLTEQVQAGAPVKEGKKK